MKSEPQQDRSGSNNDKESCNATDSNNYIDIEWAELARESRENWGKDNPY